MWRLDEFLFVALLWNIALLVALQVRVIFRQVQEIERLEARKER